MNFRKISIVVGLLIILGSFGLSNYIASSKKDPKKNHNGIVKREVLVEEVVNQSITIEIPITGKLTAKNRIEVFSEVNGKLLSTGKEFKVGVSFEKNEVLIAIEKEELEMNLLASKSNFISQLMQVLPDLKLDYPASFSQWKTFTDKLSINETWINLPVESDKKVVAFLSSRNIYNLFYQIQGQEKKLDKYTLIAPFSGVVASTNVNTGTLIRPNQKIGDFIQPGNYELESAINVEDLSFIKMNDSVKLSSPDISGEFFGKVARISKSIDPNTQTFMVFIDVQNPNLKEGMFLNGLIQGNEIKNVVKIKRRLLSGTEIFSVVDSTLSKIPIKIEKYAKDEVIVSGIENGTVILREPVAGAYNGMEVKPVN